MFRQSAQWYSTEKIALIDLWAFTLGFPTSRSVKAKTEPSYARNSISLDNCEPVI